MLGYRHAFHAGNHADVLKHVVLLDCIRYMTRKEKTLMYIDTHAGAGAYPLESGHAAQNREWESGIERLRDYSRTESPPEAVVEYLRICSDFGREYPGEYPGSPALASLALRPVDNLCLSELHSTDFEELQDRFQKDPRCRVLREDGFSFLKSILPPSSRRGLVLMDPSYEVSSDYDRLVAGLEEALRRFDTGTYLVWYPMLERPEAAALPERLLAVTKRPRLSLELRVRHSEAGQRGLAGSGMIVINPPWTLQASHPIFLPYLARALGQDGDSAESHAFFPN